MKFYILSILFTIVSWSVYGQKTQQQVTDDPVTNYLTAVNDKALIYYGRQPESHPRVPHHPYLKDMKFVNGHILYNGVLYTDVPLRLDLSRDELITSTPDFQYNIVLSPEYLEFAEFHYYHIFYLTQNNLPGCPPSGYYMLLYSGTNQVLEKQTNTLELYNGVMDFNKSVKYFLCKDDVYYQIKNKRSLLKALNAHKKELKRYIRRNKLYFNQNAEIMIVSVVAEYEKLSN